MIVTGLIMFGCGIVSACECNPARKIYSAPSNDPPIADFRVLPATGTTDTWFIVDASTSTDPDDPDEYLRYQWNWDHEPGYVGWGYPVPSPIDSHQYLNEGAYTIRLWVTDPGGNEGVCDRLIQVSGSSMEIVPFGPARKNAAGREHDR